MNLNVELNEINKLIDITEDSTLNIVGNKDSNLFIMIKDATCLNINGHFNNGLIKLIIFNQSNKNIIIKEDYQVNGAYVTVAHGFFSHNDIKIDSHTRVLKGEINYETYGLIKAKLELNELLENVLPHTSINIKNSFVVLANSILKTTACGSILKDAYNSSNLQATNCLTFGNLKNVEILPMLLIDENDVQASHSCAIGTMSELQRFYLESRGLDESQISELITTGYVLPLTRIIESDDFTQLVLRKVQELCLI